MPKNFTFFSMDLEDMDLKAHPQSYSTYVPYI